MKKYLSLLSVALTALSTLSCNKDNGRDISLADVKFRKADITGAQMLALAEPSLATKAEDGNEMNGSKALYKVSDDGTLVEVSYTVEVNGEEGEASEFIKANLKISPGFVFAVGKNWLWLANCWYDCPGWRDMPENSTRKAINRLIDDFAMQYHDEHGAHFLVRKSDGAIFQWLPEQFSPFIDDGFHQPDFTDGWLEQYGPNLYFTLNHTKVDAGDQAMSPLYCIEDKGNTLNVVNVLGDNIRILSNNGITPADNMLGIMVLYTSQAGVNAGPTAGTTLMPAVIVTPSSVPMLITLPKDPKVDNNYAPIVSVGGKLYLIWAYYDKGDINEKDGSYVGNGHDVTEFYPISISNGKAVLGEKTASADAAVSNFNTNMKSLSGTWSWWNGGNVYTFVPADGKVISKTLPDHYPENESDYYQGIAYAINGSEGFWICDLSKACAEYVLLDWRGMNEYKERIVPGSLKMERFDAASKTVRYGAFLTDGSRLDFYASVEGSDRGIVKTNVSKENENVGMIVSVMVRLN